MEEHNKNSVYGVTVCVSAEREYEVKRVGEGRGEVDSSKFNI